MDTSLKDKVAYITGGSKGIGFGIAKSVGEAGMRVAISARSEKDLEKATAQLKAQGIEVMGICSDVTQITDESDAVSQITSKWGKVDVVVANAGVGIFKNILELSPKEWNQMIETNLTGAFNTLKASVNALSSTEGYYISIASLAGTNFFANGTGYNASKFGLVGFTQAAMLDLRSKNIKVSCIMPGSVSTHFNGNEPSDNDHWKIQPEDIGQLVVDLLRMNPRTLPSKIEVRPTRPDLK